MQASLFNLVTSQTRSAPPPRSMPCLWPSRPAGLRAEGSRPSRRPCDVPVTTPRRLPRGWASGVGAAPAPGAQGDAQPWLPCTVVLVEVQPEAQEAQALIGAGRQQHQELLYHALWRQRDALTQARSEPPLCRAPRRAPAVPTMAGSRDQGGTPSMKLTTAASRERLTNGFSFWPLSSTRISETAKQARKRNLLF